MIIFENKCYKDAPDGTYISDSKTILKCFKACRTCLKQQHNTCLSCFQGYNFYLNECLSECPDGFYKNNEMRICTKCPQTCLKCLS